MDSQYKSAGIENGVTNDRVKEVAVANKRKMRGCDLVLRFLALAFSLTAAVVLGVDKQSTTVAVTLVSSLPPVNIPVTATWHHLSAFVYFVVANAIACAYATISLLLTLGNRGGKKGLATMIVVFDLVMVALLFSSVGAAGSIGLMGYQGNSHVQWKKAKFIIFKALDEDRFQKIKHLKTAKEMWNKVCELSEGNDAIKEHKLSAALEEFENFKMKSGETIDQMDTRFTRTLNEVLRLGKEFSKKEITMKVLKALSSKFNMKVTAMEESRDLEKLSLSELLSSLKAYEYKMPRMGLDVSTSSDPTAAPTELTTANPVSVLTLNEVKSVRRDAS
ncbi:hypothetical protein RD792_017177, partial [Penstemon davidsonii]